MKREKGGIWMIVEVEPGVRIYAHDLSPGTGSQPVVFVHGWPLNHKMFEYQYNALPQYGYRCIGIDQRGFGQSDKPWHGYSYDRLADDLHAVIEAMQLEDAVLIGFSVGGPVSIRYLARHGSARIKKLALIDAAAPAFVQRPDYPYGIPVQQVNELIRQTYRDRPAMLADLSGMFFNRNLGPGLLNWFQALGMEGSGHATIRYLEMLRDEDVRNDLGSIRVPTLILHGVHDRIVPYGSAQMLQQGITGSRLVPLYNSGHGSVVDEMDAVNAALLEFLR